MQQDSTTQLSRLSISLHWLVALLFIGLLCVGIYMVEFEVYDLYYTHKSLGILIIFLVIPRVIWRLKNGFPAALYEKPLQLKAATAAHITLLLATVIMPLSGMMMSGFGGHGLAVFGLELVATNPDPVNAYQVIAHNETLASLAHQTHHYSRNVVIVVLALHIGAALKHHLVDKDGTLRRMLGRQV